MQTYTNFQNAGIPGWNFALAVLVWLHSGLANGQWIMLKAGND
ncbi:MAG TPA: hypothetical protein VKC90_04160 [Chitinophagaceae bacterium]|nr:hypothetical protein [Chitinophagaceae bacterium]